MKQIIQKLKGLLQAALLYVHNWTGKRIQTCCDHYYNGLSYSHCYHCKKIYPSWLTKDGKETKPWDKDLNTVVSSDKVKNIRIF